MATSSNTFDVTEADFQSAIVERSHDVPVIVDFWAAWCGPCRTLGPMLEATVESRDGEVLLAKLDVDANPTIAQRFRVQGIPQVYGFRDGAPVSQFTGVIPQSDLDAFVDALAPSAADRLVRHAGTLTEADAESVLREALDLEPDHRAAALALAELVVERDPDAARALVSPHRPDPAAEAVISRASLAGAGDADVEGLRQAARNNGSDGADLIHLARALAARGEYDEAIDWLLRAVERGDQHRDAAREQLLAIFGMLGDSDERVVAARPRLARALF